jgi:hypothetical protein
MNNIKDETLRVITYNFKVKKRTFEFEYELIRNSIRVTQGHYSSRHNRAIQTIKKYLSNGYGTELVLRKEFKEFSDDKR